MRFFVASMLLSALVVLPFAIVANAEEPHHPHPPPQIAIDACAKAKLGDTCSFQIYDHAISGTCVVIPDTTTLACRPDHPPPPPPQAIDACAQSTSAQPDNCPFSTYIGGDNVSVHWKVVSYPNVTPTVSPFPSGDAQVSIDANDGVVHYDATYTDYTGATQTDSGDQLIEGGGDGSVELVELS